MGAQRRIFKICGDSSSLHVAHAGDAVDSRGVSTIQIRDVPEEVHAALRSKAAAAGLSLSEYMLREAIRVAERPAIADVLRRNDRREWGVAPGEAVAVLRRIRDGEPGA